MDVEPEEIPGTETAQYLLEPAPEGGAAVADDSLLIYCIDISGSMCSSTELPELQREWATLRRQATSASAAAAAATAGGAAPAVQSYISRLQCLQLAVRRQLEQFQVEHPHRRVALITFSNEVIFYGDSSAGVTPIVFTGDELNDFDKLLNEKGTASHKKMPAYEAIGPISRTAEGLIERITALEENGPTALGPALLVALQLASQRRGSGIVVCTDGASNIGVGGVEDADSASFYQKVGNLALAAGVTISILAMENSDAGLRIVGKSAEISAGTINSLNPLELVRQLRLIGQNQQVASEVTVKVVLPSFLSLRFSSPAVYDSRGAFPLGNVSKHSMATFSFGWSRSKSQRHSVATLPTTVPIQIQVHFTDKSGAKLLRVVTRSLRITDDRDTAERGLDASVIGLTTIHRLAASVAQAESQEEVARARYQFHATRLMLLRGATNDTQQEEFDNFIAFSNNIERESFAIQKNPSLREADATIRVIMEAKNQTRERLLAGSRKPVSSRENTNSELRSRYYSYQI